jgi:hypothetical protein
MGQSPFWEANNTLSQSRISVHTYGTRRFITCTQEPTSDPYVETDEPIHTAKTSFHKNILLLSFHIRLCLPSCLIPINIQTKILYALFISHLCYVARPFHSVRTAKKIQHFSITNKCRFKLFKEMFALFWELYVTQKYKMPNYSLLKQAKHIVITRIRRVNGLIV